MPVYPQFVSDDPRDCCKDDPDALTIVNNNDHPVKLFASEGQLGKFGGFSLQPGHWFRCSASRLLRQP